MTSKKISGLLTSTAAIVAAITSFTGCSGDDGRSGLACYDKNMNRQCDLRTEDVNGDGECDVDDCVGENGEDGVDGADGQDGTNGVDGVDGVDGQDGVNGVSCAVAQEGNCAVITCVTTSAVVCDGNAAVVPDGCSVVQDGTCAIIYCGADTAVVCSNDTSGTGGSTSGTGGTSSTGGTVSHDPDDGGGGPYPVNVYRIDTAGLTDNQAMYLFANPDEVADTYADCTINGDSCGDFDYADGGYFGDSALVNYTYNGLVGQYVVEVVDCQAGDRLEVGSTNPMHGVLVYWDGSRYEESFDSYGYSVTFSAGDDCSQSHPAYLVVTAEDTFWVITQ